MVFGLDRLGRSLRDLLQLLDELAAAGCVVISLREAIDLSTPTGRLLVHLISSPAEFERCLTADRVRSGLARVKATGRTRTGKAIGRPRRDLDVDAIYERRAMGRSWRSIVQALKVRVRTLRRTPWKNPSPERRPEPPRGGWVWRKLKVVHRGAVFSEEMGARRVPARQEIDLLRFLDRLGSHRRP